MKHKDHISNNNPADMSMGDNDVRDVKLPVYKNPALVLYQLNTGRIIEVPAGLLMKYAFYQMGDENNPKSRLHFKRNDNGAGNKCLAYAVGEIIVYKYPTSNLFHKEYLRNNRCLLSGWGGLDHEDLVENMLEYVETI